MKVLRRDVTHIRWNPFNERWEYFSTVPYSWKSLINQIPLDNIIKNDYEPCDYDVIVSYEDSWCEPVE